MQTQVTTAARLDPSAPKVLRTPLLGSLLERVRAEGRKVILDLGSARATTVELFNRFHCRLDIVDLATGLEELNGQEDTGLLVDHVESILPMRREEPTDIVLCWDLLNYLQRPVLTSIMNNITSRSRAGTLVHALIMYSSRNMPASPGIYFPHDKIMKEPDDIVDQLVCVPTTAEECEAPLYTPDILKRCMQGYYIERAVLLSNGMQEFLFRIS